MSTDLSIIENNIRMCMESGGVTSQMIIEFLRRVRQVYDGDTGKVSWQDVGELESGDLVDFESLTASDNANNYMHSLVVIKLNGGLGTSMGLQKPKSLIPIRGRDNFLQVIIQQIKTLRCKTNSPIPFFLMNSFSTQKDSLRELGIANINQDVHTDLPVDFLQNRVPRLYKNSLLPLSSDSNTVDGTEQDWCPPGHGDIFFSLKQSGLLDRLLDMGYRTAFISNGDNLGAIAESKILEYFHQQKLDWISEVTLKTPVDLKGGVLYRPRPKNPGTISKAIRLLEIAQVPEEHLNDFQDTKRFSYFNINNLWVNLAALNTRLEEKSLNLDLIVNPKTVASKDVVQLETAMGSAVSCFNNSRVILVPRHRFSPVKTCADLLACRSDIYQINPTNQALVPNMNRAIPQIILNSAYKNVSDFEKLFAIIPSLQDTQRLEITGKLYFDVPVKIKGRVSFRIKGTEPFAISRVKRKEFQDEDIEL